MKELAGKIDLKNTLESGQTFRWRKIDSETGEDIYRSVINGYGVELIQKGKKVSYRSNGINPEALRRYLGLNISISKILEGFPDDELLNKAVGEYRYMRLINEEFFPCTLSFIISSNNNIPRITNLVQKINKEYGEHISGYGYSTPPPRKIASLSEDELRKLGVGYRAPYIIESAEMIANGELDPVSVREMDYKNAHKEIQKLMGVGDKVADCILLFSLGFNEAVPLDRWMWRSIEKYYPKLHGDKYMDTCENFRDKFGGYSGYAQNYIFHYIRNLEE